jgi:hypothetical protein
MEEQVRRLKPLHELDLTHVMPVVKFDQRKAKK